MQNRIAGKLAVLGRDYLMKEPPPLIKYDTDRLARRAKNEKLFARLNAMYAPVPGVECGDCGNVCCSASPDFYLLEYLNVWRYIRYELADPELEAEILRRAARWAFLSFFSPDVFCPFLVDRKCVIYDVRPFNCRVWALEDDAYYESKAKRSGKHLAKLAAFFDENGLRTFKPLEQFVLPKCRSITVKGGDGPMSEEQIVEMDTDIALLHRVLIRPEEFRSINFHLHFPGHVVTAKLPLDRFDETRVAVAREYTEHGTEKILDGIVAGYDGKLP